MASSKDYLVYVLELLREVEGITYKKMMGEYMLRYMLERPADVSFRPRLKV